jgi:hypothetical protein
MAILPHERIVYHSSVPTNLFEFVDLLGSSSGMRDMWLQPKADDLDH